MARRRGRLKQQARPPAAPGGLGRALRRLAFPTLAVLIVVGVTAGLIFAVTQVNKESQSAGAEAEQDRDPSLPGEWIDPGGVYGSDEHTGTHFAAGTVYPVCTDEVTENCYTSNPPTSGSHDPVAVQWGIYDEPQRKEQLLHNMEHAGVVVWYNCTGCEDVISELKDIVLGYLEDGRLLVMTPYPEMEPDTIALTGWSRLDKFGVDEFDEGRVRRFIEAHECRFDPESIC